MTTAASGFCHAGHLHSQLDRDSVFALADTKQLKHSSHSPCSALRHSQEAAPRVFANLKVECLGFYRQLFAHKWPADMSAKFQGG